MKRLIPALAILAAAVLAVAAEPDQAPPDPRDFGPDRIDISDYPPEQQQRYPIFEKKCAKCHPVARAIGSRFSTAEWKRYMKRMVRRPNAGVTDRQADAIFEFLCYYARRLGMN